MNTNHLKKFAQEARRKLLEQVNAKLSFVLTTDSVELREKTEQVKQLREQLNKTSKEQLIEKVTYTWFNRLMALRFMDANDYQPLGIRIITPKDGYTIPELLDEAKRGNIPEELKLNRQKVYDLLDNRMPSTNPQNEAFKELLIASCNYLHTTFPFLFEKINDYTELLLPDDLTSDFSIVTDICKGMPVEDCKNVEIIGWLYQFYISEKKDEVFASKAKVKKEDIPAATQLFTPRWIVEYMVQNTVGKLWLQNRPKSKLREHMPYFIESASLTADDYLKISSPEEIKFADPASGSGHILVYAFDLFTKIYEEEGYNTSEIPKLIIEKNLYGFEIDERAAQLSGMALMMKAREYQRRAFRKDLQPNILCFQDLLLNSNEIKETLNSLNINISDELMNDLLQMQQATNFGSLILPHANKSEIIQLLEKLNQLAPSVDVFQRGVIDALLNAFSQLSILSEKYYCVVTNPPYMGSGNMNKELSEWVKSNYPKAKADLFSCFIERSLKFVQIHGYNGLVTMESWMFLSSFENFRKELLKSTKIHSLSHFGWHIMRIAFGTVSFILENSIPESEFKGSYSYLEIEDIDKTTERPIVFPKKDNERYKITNQKDFEKIPSSPIGYWLSRTVVEIFNNSKRLDSIYEIGSGLSTSNNERFIRYHWEIGYMSRIDINKKINTQFEKRWYPFQKGGGYRKWFGNLLYVVNWKNDGEDIKNWVVNNPKDPKTTHWSRRIFNVDLFFRKGITWSTISSGEISFRLTQMGTMISNAAGGIFGFDNDEVFLKMLSVLNTKLWVSIIKFLNPTLNYSSGIIQKTPSIENLERLEIDNTSIKVAKEDWDNKEYSYEFKRNELIRINSEKNNNIEKTFELYLHYWENKFFKLHEYEEEINRQIIKIYGLEKEFFPDVPLENITILQEELDRKLLVNQNKKLFRDHETFAVQNYHEISLPFIAKEIMAQFISYSVGCMFGRYCLDKEGLILANQGETFQDYLQKIDKSKENCTFLPDEDNIIPILDNEWFEDDIVGRFYEFLKVTFGENNFNKNLAFIEEQIGNNIRKYFIKDFYPDHIKRYKKRPIYWMFSSPKGAFNVIIYMHRYTPDTVSNILNNYLKEFIGKLNTRKEHLQHIQVSGSPTEKNKAIKESDRIEKMLIELQEYERDVLYPLAMERIAIDLDDGVLVNYNKFGKAVKEVKGLNDNKTKDKVRKFDWINTTQIR